MAWPEKRVPLRISHLRMGVSNRGYIMEKGQIQHHDQMERIWENQEVVKTYLVV
jgi:ABC-type branched-subunit amino acid transport system ATPase component